MAKRRRGKRRPKEIDQRRHAIQRFKERYFEISRHDYDNMVNIIINGQSKVVQSQSHRVKVHVFTYRDKVVTAVYDKTRKQIATFLPEGCEPGVFTFSGDF